MSILTTPMEMVAQLLGTQDLPIFSRGIFSILDIAMDLSCLIKLVSSILYSR
jgi:hypothetical protein